MLPRIVEGQMSKISIPLLAQHRGYVAKTLLEGIHTV